MRIVRWLVPACLALGCRGTLPETGIMLGLSTDLTVPMALDRVDLYVEHVKGAEHTLVVSQRLTPLFDPARGTYAITFTATFAVQASTELEGDSIRARLLGFDGAGTAVVMREARVRLPPDHVRQLPLSLRFVNEGRVAEVGGDAARGSPFTRWHHPDCADDETLDDEGTCHPIDVELAELREGSAYELAPTCLDATACFGGQGGVQDLDINADCTISTVGLGAPLALAVHEARGYDVGDVALQPVDDVLYESGDGVLTLRAPLCARAMRSGGRVRVSARCAPKPTSTPICAGWEGVAKAAPVNASATFPAASAAGRDDDGGADAGPLARSFTRVITLPEEIDTLVSFATQPDGKTWLLHRGSRESATVAAPGRDDTPTATYVQGLPAAVQGSLDLAGGAAYLVPRYGHTVQPKVLRPGATRYVDVQLGGPTCRSGAIAPARFFAIGTLQGSTIGMYGGPAAAASVVDAADPGCFRDDVALDGAPPMVGAYHGTVLGGAFFLPAVSDNVLLQFAPNRSAGVTPLPDLRTSEGRPVVVRSLVGVGNGNALAVGTGLSSTALDTTYHLLRFDGETPPSEGALVAQEIGGVPTYETYGGPRAMCTRLLANDGTFDRVDCVRTGGGTAGYRRFRLGADGLSDLHVFGDANNLYVARPCVIAGEQRYSSIYVLGLPWDLLSETTLTDDLSVLCPSPR